MLTTILVLAFGMVQQDWYTFEPEGKSFRVELPSKPNHTSSRTVNNAAGRSQLTTAQLRTSGAIYSVQVTENSGKVDPKTLDEGIQRFAAAIQGALGTVSTITVDGSPGREFEMTERLDEGQKRSKMRWVAAGNSLFMLSVAGKPGAKLPANADRFLGSLEIGAAKEAAGARARVKAAETEDSEANVKEADTGEDKAKSASKSSGKTAGRKSNAAAKVTISRIPRNAKSYPAEDLEDLSRSYFGKEREGFRDVGPAGSVLVGVRVSYIERFGGPKVRSAQPIYRSGKTHYQGQVYGEVVGPVTTVVAKPGYAVGGLVTHAGLTLDGFRIVFMKVDGDRLDPDDSYNSPWIGDEKGGGPGEVNSKGGLVVGLQGRSRDEIFILGLTALK